jgi:4-hydroxy-3-methylbut-2-enyl diphosphate reductase
LILNDCYLPADKAVEEGALANVWATHNHDYRKQLHCDSVLSRGDRIRVDTVLHNLQSLAPFRYCSGVDPRLEAAAHAGDSAVDLVVLAAPRGFCAGVEMAIKALARMVRTFQPPVYCFHEIVHNKSVVDRFIEQGVVFVDDITAVPPGRPIMLSAHGSAPEVVEEAKRRGSYVVDSVCPLVTKVHHEVKVRANKGYRIVYVGHEGHEEAVGTMAVAPTAISRVESIEEVDALPQFAEPVALLAQTTLSHRDWMGVADAVKTRYPDVWTPGRSDLCFATTNRQSALMHIAERCDVIIVIGSANSSNTLALEKLARDVGCSRVLRVNSSAELPPNLSGTIGVTAGASAPEEIVRGVLDALKPRLGVEEVRITDEDEYFPPPRNIRQLQTTLEQAAAAMVGGNPLRSTLDDRQVSASDVLLHFRQG